MTYEELVKKARQRTSKLTLEQQSLIRKIYEEAIETLVNKAGKSKGILTKTWAMQYATNINEVKRELEKTLLANIQQALIKTGENAISEDLQLFALALAPNELIQRNVSQMFAKVPVEVIESIISGGLYKDGKGLSTRIWQTTNQLGQDIDYIILKAMAEQKSAVEMAKDLETFVNPPEKRPTTWGAVYPNLRGKVVDYNAMRVARTSINHAHQMVTIKSANRNPYVDGIKWRSALVHGRTCKICRDRHNQVYSKENVPLDHPNGLCTMLPEITKSLEDIGAELGDWARGGKNPKLDNWYYSL